MKNLLTPSTLGEILIWWKDAEDKGITFIGAGNKEEFLSYHQLYVSSLSWLRYFQERGLQPGDELVLQIEDNKTFIQLFWACIFGGIRVVPLAVSYHSDNDLKLFNIWKILNNPYIATSLQNLERIKKSAYENNIDFQEGLRDKSILSDAIMESEAPGKIFKSEAGDIAFIQFSSGSTGTPKGITLTHKNLISNIMAIQAGIKLTSSDSSVSWMPLTHDMGLIGFHLVPLATGIDHYIIPTDVFVRHPGIWLKSVSKYRARVTSSPNFGYKHFLAHLKDDAVVDLDLSCLRLMFNGAEPISSDLCRTFLDKMARYGLRKEVMFTVYGMAEATLAVSFPKLEKEFSSLFLNRKKMGLGQEVEISNDLTSDSLELVNLGKPVSECNIKITDDTGSALREGQIGYIKIKGINVTSGYYNNPRVSELLIEDGWLNTGDLGFIKDEDLYITGRAKDLIITNGLNIYPHDIEATVENIGEIGPGKVAACGVRDPLIQTEAVAIFVVYKKNLESFYNLVQQIKILVAGRLGIEVKYAIPVKNIPKTTSGKIKRFTLAEGFQNGDYDEIIASLKNIQQTQKGNISTGIEDHTDAINENNSGQVYIQDLIEQWLSKRLDIERGIISPLKPFAEQGVTSIMAVQLAQFLEDRLKIPVNTTIAWTFSNIKALAEHLSRESSKDYAAADNQHLQSTQDHNSDLSEEKLDQLSEEELELLLFEEIRRCESITQ